MSPRLFGEPERWPSGRRRPPAKRVYGQKPYRGFESHPLRQPTCVRAGDMGDTRVPMGRGDGGCGRSAFILFVGTSCGHGATRGLGRRRRSLGLRTTSFSPSLLQEASLGLSVAFDRRGAPLLLHRPQTHRQRNSLYGSGPQSVMAVEEAAADTTAPATGRLPLSTMRAIP